MIQKDMYYDDNAGGGHIEMPQVVPVKESFYKPETDDKMPIWVKCIISIGIIALAFLMFNL